MKNVVLFLWISLLFTACETGTKYDTNTSNEKSDVAEQIDEDELDKNELDDPTHSESYYIDQGEDNYIEEIALANREVEDVVPRDDISEEEFIEESQLQREESNTQHFEGGTIADGLDIKSIRKANHDSYIRVVFDSVTAPKVGSYSVDYNSSKKLVTVVLDGYRKFSAKFPTFENSSIVEKMGFVKYLDDSGYKIHINLRESTKIKVMALESPARLVIDIQKP